MQAARAAAALRRDGFDVILEKGDYAELTVFVDGKEVLSASKLAALGIVPTIKEIRAAVVEASKSEE